ncbi:hypothetical protein [Deinococcus sp. QL22]|uniref:hypothetical protein n=1 Tax=Deinococcus sp. QL22 TaxID=2939437 RepID=UPI002017C804|nr:hypothetical protein [Deinococcus sp. QL22]UQN09839.1 hypothetical protein M1R55_25595 [Deinococcus sp. QL22]
MNHRTQITGNPPCCLRDPPEVFPQLARSLTPPEQIRQSADQPLAEALTERTLPSLNVGHQTDP